MITVPASDINELRLTAARFNHCATLCPLLTGTLVAWYAGSGECQADQSVHLLYITEDGRSELLRLADGTGNPVLWALNQDSAMLLWSEFSSIPVTRLVDKWKHCNIWIQQVCVGKRIQLLGEPQLLASAKEHLLGRCPPVRFRTKLYLPLYNEMDRHGMVLEGNGSEFRKLTGPGIVSEVPIRLGHNMIQPALWTTASRIHSLSRNFHSDLKTAQYSYSTSGGHYWSEPTNTTICNNNSSLATLNWKGRTLLMWNDTTKRQRERMMLGEFPNPAYGIMLNARHGAYPSMCENNDGSLSLAYSRSDGIAYIHLTERQYLQHRRRNLARTNSGDRDSAGATTGEAGILRVGR